MKSLRVKARRMPILLAGMILCLLGASSCLFPQCEDIPACDDPARPYWCGECRECCLDSHCAEGLICYFDRGCAEYVEPEGPFQCSDGLYHECCDDEDCAFDEECIEDYTCEPICHDVGEDCLQYDADCCDGSACDYFTWLCAAACLTDADCVAGHPEVEYGSDLRCRPDGRCAFSPCEVDADCDPMMVCSAGGCVTPLCGLQATCVVVPGAFTLRPGASAPLTAWPLLTSGALAPGLVFEWTSSDEAIAAITGGGVTGGDTAGTATITASVGWCGLECTAQVRNLGPVVDGARVLVVDAATGEPLAGVGVAIDGVGAADTDAGGVALFAGVDLAATPATLNVAAGDVGYVSIVEADSNDLLVPVPLAPDPPQVGGVRGIFDFDQLRCEPGNPCEVKLGMAGLSSPGWPLDWSLTDLMGEPVMVHLELGGTSEDMGYPGGTAIGLNDTWFREEFMALGERGPRVVWGLGGRTNLADLIELLGPVISGDTPADLFSAVAVLLDEYASQASALGPLRFIGSVDRLLDEDDLDGDGSTDDLVPDYQAFDELPSPLPLKVPCQHTILVQVPELPLDQDGGHVFDGVLVMAGVLVEGSGLVPLGLTLGSDAPMEGDEPDGFVDDIELSCADVVGRLPPGSYRRVVLALAIRGAQLMPDADPAEPFLAAGQAHFVDAFPDSLTLRPFAHPPLFQHDPQARQVSVQFLGEGADAMVVLGRGEGSPGDWKIFAPAALGPLALPPAPAAGDRQDRVGLAALWLTDGVGLSDLAAFSDTNLDDLAGVVTDFAIAYPAGHPPLIGCATAGGHPGHTLLGLFLLAGARWIRRRRL